MSDLVVPEQGGAAGAPLLVRLRAALPDLAPAERRVGQRVLDDPYGTAALTISELAQAAATSETTVIRFCKALGLPGYPQLRLTLAAESGGGGAAQEVGAEIGPDDDLRDVVAKVAWADARAVEETAQQLDVPALERVVDALAGAARVDVYGVGASAFVAADLQQKLHRIGRVAFAWSDTHIALTSAALLRPGDVAVAVSHTGTTAEVVEALRLAGRRGATTVAVTNFPRSPVARAADHVLTTAARETTYRSGAMASRIAQLVLVDCLFIGLAQRLLPEAREALGVTYEAVRAHHLDGRSADR
ncbi:MurR/RpiR family transcriptional regulator [Vallicoccus soli]|uniref:MurR/RpiR family transcriptional regulator n=1 Tax=Vallicoccus soli TaxID=2339232 RepID=UPI001C49A7EC|nr:MurR/RpiR family transcriptional regulator [Vallicoccus soli]